MKFSMPPSRYANDAQIAAFCRQVEEKLSAMAGIKSVSFSDGLPLTRIGVVTRTPGVAIIHPDGRREAVTGGYEHFVS